MTPRLPCQLKVKLGDRAPDCTGRKYQARYNGPIQGAKGPVVGGGARVRSKGADCKSVAECYGGSNPPLPIRVGRLMVNHWSPKPELGVRLLADLLSDVVI